MINHYFILFSFWRLWYTVRVPYPFTKEPIPWQEDTKDSVFIIEEKK